MRDQMPPQEWSDYELEGPDPYDPARYYHHVTHDGYGHTASEQFREAPNVVAQINKLVADDLTPYKTRADFHRDADIHRLAWLHNNAPELPGDLNAELVAIRLQTKRDTAQAFRNVVTHFEEVMGEAFRNHEHQLLGEYLEEADRLAPSLQSPYRDNLEEIIARYTPPRRRA